MTSTKRTILTTGPVAGSVTDTWRRALRSALAVLAIALLAGACGGDDDATGDTAVPTAVSTTDAATTTPQTAATTTTTTRAAEPSTTAGNEPVTITMLSHDSFNISDDVMEAFTADTGITVELLEGGDAGSALAQAILTRDNPTADLLFGVDNTFLSRALDEKIFIPYEAAGLDRVDPDLILDGEHRVTPVDYGDVCINYDKEALRAEDTEPPTSLEDLTAERFAGDLVVEDPATSSPGLSFLLATIATFGESGDYTWEDYWSDLAANDVLVTSGWEEAYYGSFSGGGASEGDRPLVVSYASSPPAEVLFAEEPTDEAPTASMTDGCFRQIEFVGILAGTEHEEAAQRFVDFMISEEFQADIPLNMFVWPAVTDTPLPDVFTEHAALSEDPLTVDPTEIDAMREEWIQTWTDILR